MSAHIHTHTYIHTRIQNVHMNARKVRRKRRRGSDCAGSPTLHQEALPFSLSASRQRAVQTTSAYLHWCGADPPNSLSTPAHSLAMPAHGPPKRGHFPAILAGYFHCRFFISHCRFFISQTIVIPSVAFHNLKCQHHFSSPGFLIFMSYRSTLLTNKVDSNQCHGVFTFSDSILHAQCHGYRWNSKGDLFVMKIFITP